MASSKVPSAAASTIDKIKSYQRGKDLPDRELTAAHKRGVPKKGEANTLQGELVRCINNSGSWRYGDCNMDWIEAKLEAIADDLIAQTRSHLKKMKISEDSAMVFLDPQLDRLNKAKGTLPWSLRVVDASGLGIKRDWSVVSLEESKSSQFENRKYVAKEIRQIAALKPVAERLKSVKTITLQPKADYATFNSGKYFREDRAYETIRKILCGKVGRCFSKPVLADIERAVDYLWKRIVPGSPDEETSNKIAKELGLPKPTFKGFEGLGPEDSASALLDRAAYQWLRANPRPIARKVRTPRRFPIMWDHTGKAIAWDTERM